MHTADRVLSVLAGRLEPGVPLADRQRSVREKRTSGTFVRIGLPEFRRAGLGSVRYGLCGVLGADGYRDVEHARDGVVGEEQQLRQDH